MDTILNAARLTPLRVLRRNRPYRRQRLDALPPRPRPQTRRARPPHRPRRVRRPDNGANSLARASRKDGHVCGNPPPPHCPPNPSPLLNQRTSPSADTLPKQQQHIPSLRRTLPSSPDLFKKTYKATFALGRAPGGQGPPARRRHRVLAAAPLPAQPVVEHVYDALVGLVARVSGAEVEEVCE